MSALRWDRMQYVATSTEYLLRSILLLTGQTLPLLQNISKPVRVLGTAGELAAMHRLVLCLLHCNTH